MNMYIELLKIIYKIIIVILKKIYGLGWCGYSHTKPYIGPPLVTITNYDEMHNPLGVGLLMLA
jgi:hypothetical protein